MKGHAVLFSEMTPPEGGEEAFIIAIVLVLPDELDVNDESGTVACPLCGWSTGFNADSTTSQNLAKSRVAKHLKTAKKEPDRHRDLWQKLFA